MANTNEINANIAKNLIYYRKTAGLTQAELAEKINYSDKSVSKWESGNGVPDVYTLMQIAELYGVTLNDLVGEDAPRRKETSSEGLHVLIMMLSSGIVWLVATCFFVVMKLFNPEYAAWLIFLYAVAVNAIVIIVYASLWKHRLVNFCAVTVLIWISIVCAYLTGRFVSIRLGNKYEGLWCVFLLGIPLQVLEILWVFFRSLFRKNKKKRAQEKQFVEALAGIREEKSESGE